MPNLVGRACQIELANSPRACSYMDCGALRRRPPTTGFARSGAVCTCRIRKNKGMDRAGDNDNNGALRMGFICPGSEQSDLDRRDHTLREQRLLDTCPLCIILAQEGGL